MGYFYTVFVSCHMYPENPKRTQVIIGSMNMGYISDTARNRTHNLGYSTRNFVSLPRMVLAFNVRLVLESWHTKVCKQINGLN